MIHKTLLVCSLLFAVVSAQKQINLRRCDDPGRGKILSVVITPCDAEPCQLRKGSNVTVDFKYISDQDSEAVTLKAYVIAHSHLKVPIPGLNRDLCKAIKCPVEKGKEYSGSFSMRVPRGHSVDSTFEVSIGGVSGLSACFKFSAQLV